MEQSNPRTTLERSSTEWANFSTLTRDILRTDQHWRDLVDAGMFEEQKALLSMQLHQDDIGKLNANTPAQAMQCNAPTIATIRKYRGQEKATGILMYLIGNATFQLNISKRMNQQQVRTAAEIISGEYYYLNLADFKLCFQKGISGEYGQIFDRVDISVLCDWLRQYTEHRSEAAEQSSISAHQERKTAPTKWNQEALQKLADLSEKIQAKQKADIAESNEHANDYRIHYYNSIEDYCLRTGIDFDEYSKQLYAEWEQQYTEYAESMKAINREAYEIDKDIFMCWKYNQHLLQINSRSK